jgi:uncharacterized membrane protein
MRQKDGMSAAKIALIVLVLDIVLFFFAEDLLSRSI